MRIQLTFITVLITLLQVSAVSLAQKVTINEKNTSLEKVFKTIRKQTGYNFIYTDRLLAKVKLFDIQLKDATIEQVLAQALKDQDLDFTIDDKTVVIKKREPTLNQQIPKALAPPQTITGKVTDENGDPLIGATIKRKSDNLGVSTSNDGSYTIVVSDQTETLIISYIGYKTKEVKADRTLLNITLETDLTKLDEVIVTAYGTTTAQTNVSALTVVQGEQIETLPNMSFDKSLQGLVPGLLVTSGTGQPGGGLSNFVLRGIATGQDPLGGTTVRNPLIVIDGVPVSQDNNQWTIGLTETPVFNPIAQLNSSDIDNITVLKDAAAISLYGSKASNGVILITTKSGKVGKTVISFRNQTDVAIRLKGNLAMVNQEEYLQLVSESLANFNPYYSNPVRVTDTLKKMFPVRSDGSLYPFTNWDDEIYTKGASTLTNELSVSGGNDRTKFYLNIGYNKQNGVVKKTGFDRKSLRFNFDHNINNWLKTGLNATASYNIQDYASLFAGFPTATAALNSPLNPVRLEDGNYFLNFVYPYSEANPVASNEFNTRRNTSFRGLTKLYAEIDLPKNFHFTSNIGTDFMLMEVREINDPRIYDVGNTSTPGTPAAGRIQERNTRNANLITANLLRYTNNIKKNHKVDVVAGQEAQILTNTYIEGSGTGLQLNGQVTSTQTKTSASGTFKQTLLSYFGQANYGYKNKYFFTSSLRSDGSSLFGENNRFGTYWSAGAGWVLSEEKLFKNRFPSINFLKLRGSVGASGNSFAINQNTRYDRLNIGNYQNNITVFPELGGLGNPDIKWEKTFTWDGGLEAKLLKQRISFSADYYKRKTQDVIYTVNLPLTTGFSSISANIGDIENKGIELALSVDLIKNRNFRWNVNTNWSANKNILVKANVPLVAVAGTVLGNEVGGNYNSFYLVEWAGVNPADGASMWIDSTGTPNTNISAAKRKFVGKPQPDGFGAITNTVTYKGFQVSAMFNYQYGFQIYNLNSLTNDGSSVLALQDKRALDRWRKPGDVAANPKRIVNNPNVRNSTRYLYDGDFLRFQTLSVSYSFGKNILEKYGLTNLRVFAQAYNLALWTKFPGEDVANTNAAGGVGLAYPNQKTYSMGVNFTF